MTGADLLRAEFIGSREFRQNAKKYLESDKITVITVNGKPKGVLVPYDMMIDLLARLGPHGSA